MSKVKLVNGQMPKRAMTCFARFCFVVRSNLTQADDIIADVAYRSVFTSSG